MRRVAAAFVVAICLTAACSGASGSHSNRAGSAAAITDAPPPIGPISVITNPTEVVRPIDAYVPSAAEVLDVLRAGDIAASRCMATYGIAFTPPEPATLDSLARDRLTRSSLYGFFDPANAATSGYAASGDDGLTVTAPLDQDGQRVYEGQDPVTNKTVARFDGRPVPKGGCMQVGLDAIGGVKPVPDEASLPDGGPTVAANDPRVVAAYARWSTCMRSAGYNYSNPIAAISDSKWSTPPPAGQKTPPVSAIEIATATADINCKVSTNLVGIAVAVQSAYDNRYIESHATQLVAYQDQLQGYIKAVGAGH